MNRNEAIKTIKAGLKARSGKVWSVTGGRGTSWGWITIDTMPARRADGYLTQRERDELGQLLGLTSVHHQGVSIPASSDYYQEYVERAEGKPVTKIAKPYWD